MDLRTNKHCHYAPHEGWRTTQLPTHVTYTTTRQLQRSIHATLTVQQRQQNVTSPTTNNDTNNYNYNETRAEYFYNAPT